VRNRIATRNSTNPARFIEASTKDYNPEKLWPGISRE
jgi:hypothetical protein